MRKLVIIACLLVHSVIGQDWSLSRCIDSALSNNVEVQLANLNKQKNQVVLKNQKWSLLPNLNANVYHGYNIGQTIDPFTNTFATNTVQYDNFYLNSSLVLFSGLQNHYSSQINKLELEKSEWELALQKRDKSIEVSAAFLQVQLNRSVKEAAIKQLEFVEVQHQRIQQLVNIGKEPESNLLEIEAQLAKEKFLVQQASSDLKLSLFLLQQIIGRVPDTSFQVSQDIGGIASGSQKIVTAPEQELARISRELKLIENKRIKGELMPKLLLNGSLGTGYSQNNTFLSPTGEYVPQPFRNQLSENFYQSVSASLNIPIFNGNQIKTRIKLSELDLLQNQLESDRIKTNLKLELEKIKMDISNSNQQYTSAQKMVDAAKLHFENSQLKFEKGVINFVELMDAKTAYFSANLELIQAEFRKQLNTIILGYYKGI